MNWKYKSGKGIWKQYKNTKTGELSIKEHKLKTVKKWCERGKHCFFIEDMKKRLAVCSKCGQELTFIVGKHKIKDNKILLS